MALLCFYRAFAHDIGHDEDQGKRNPGSEWTPKHIQAFFDDKSHKQKIDEYHKNRKTDGRQQGCRVSESSVIVPRYDAKSPGATNGMNDERCVHGHELLSDTHHGATPGPTYKCQQNKDKCFLHRRNSLRLFTVVNMPQKGDMCMLRSFNLTARSLGCIQGFEQHFHVLTDLLFLLIGNGIQYVCPELLGAGV